MKLEHVAIIVSNESGVEFYKSLGFSEISRVLRPECHDELIYLSNGELRLEIYKDFTHPKRVSNPEAYGLRHLCFIVDKIEGECKVNSEGQKYKFIVDPDGQPIELKEIK